MEAPGIEAVEENAQEPENPAGSSMSRPDADAEPSQASPCFAGDSKGLGEPNAKPDADVALRAAVVAAIAAQDYERAKTLLGMLATPPKTKLHRVK